MLLRSVTVYVTLIPVAIKRFRHQGLEQFFAAGTKRGIQRSMRIDCDCFLAL
jgi:hypothetical protein